MTSRRDIARTVVIARTSLHPRHNLSIEDLEGCERSGGTVIATHVGRSEGACLGGTAELERNCDLLPEDVDENDRIPNIEAGVHRSGRLMPHDLHNQRADDGQENCTVPLRAHVVVN